MNTKYEFAGQNEENLVYVRPVLVADLPEDVQREVEDIDTLYAVHRADGTDEDEQARGRRPAVEQREDAACGDIYLWICQAFPLRASRTGARQRRSASAARRALSRAGFS